MPDDPQYVQRGFGLKAEVAGELASDYQSLVVEKLRHLGTIKTGSLELHLAAEFGFCYGVDRAIDLAYEARRHFPERTLHLTNEIIHNPYVNRRLEELGIRFFGADSELGELAKDDIVLLPAFGATRELIAEIQDRGCVIVDTTCGSVMNVWKRVEQYSRDCFTSVIHGKWYHEETIATRSRALSDAGGRCLVVRDRAEAELVCAQIRGEGMASEEFLERFSKALSEGFDPERDLERVGVANQTTMLANESLFISGMLEAAMKDRFGAEALPEHFRRFDTICSATQDRQDAIIALGEREQLDLMLVVGGFNSSNTANLCKIAGRYAPSYHIAGPEEILDAGRIKHLPPGEKELVEAQDWLPKAPLRVGLTSGASTPNSIVAAVIERLGELCGVDAVRAIHDELPMLPEDVPGGERNGDASYLV